MRAAERASGPLGDAELDIVFAPFAGARLIALAVSGGADSLALMVAADRWRRSREGRPDLLVLTVDHRLRRGSAGEARMVAAAAKARGLPHRTLVRRGPAPSSDIEAAARQARYRLLIAAAVEAGASHILTAHHRDDVAEGFLIRLARGAGVFGLAAMRREVSAGGVVIARPFLSIGRDRLAATARAAGLTPAVDAMNADPRYARARVRALLPHLAGEGLDPGRIAETAMRLADAAEAIEAAVTALIAGAVTADTFAVARLDPAAFAAAPREVRLRALARVLHAVGGEDYPPRFQGLERLLAVMETPSAAARFKRTLARTVIEQRDGKFLFYREGGREPLPAAALKPGLTIVWDHRFAVAADRRLPRGLRIAALGDDGRRAVGAAGEGTPAAALATLPAIRRGGRIIAVPSLGYFDNNISDLPIVLRPILDVRLLRPPLFPDSGGGD
jgi:tRNA(Ile)-lysidine synthase